MKVLHVSAPLSTASGGLFEAVRQLTNALVVGGVGVSVRMPEDAKAQASVPMWQSDTRVVGKIVMRQLGYSPAFEKEVLSVSTDVLHSHGLWLHPSWVALKWKRRKNAVHILSVHGMLEDWALKHRSWKKIPVWWALERRNFRSASLLHATSIAEAGTLKRRGACSPIAVIPNGVTIPDNAQILLAGTHRGAVKEERYALFLSRIHPIKGLPLLLNAWATIRPAKWKLKIVGPNEANHLQELKRMSAQLGLENSVEFHDPVHDERSKAMLFSEASLFVLPSYSENFGIAAAEALAHGVPVIATHGSPWELLRSENCGWWVPVETGAIAEALREATMSSEGQLAEMGDRGRELMIQRFSWRHIADEFIGCYRWLLGAGERPQCILDPG